MKVKVYSTSKHPLPQYATKQSAGLDLRANIDAPITYCRLLFTYTILPVITTAMIYTIHLTALLVIPLLSTVRYANE